MRLREPLRFQPRTRQLTWRRPAFRVVAYKCKPGLQLRFLPEAVLVEVQVNSYYRRERISIGIRSQDQVTSLVCFSLQSFLESWAKSANARNISSVRRGFRRLIRRSVNDDSP